MSEQSVSKGYYAREEEDEISLLQMFEIVKKWKFVILAFVVVAFVIACGYLLISKTPPSYEATGKANVRPMLNVTSKNSTNITEELQVMLFSTTMQRALESLDLSSYTDSNGIPYSQNGLSIEQMAKQMLDGGKVSIAVASGTNIVSFTVKDDNSQFCVDFANALMASSSEILREMSKSSTQRQKELLEEQVTSTQVLLTSADEELSSFKKENGVIQMSQKIALLTKRIATLQLMVEPLNLELSESEAVVSSFYSKNSMLPKLEDIEKDETVLSLVADYKQYVSELLMYSTMDASSNLLYISLNNDANNSLSNSLSNNNDFPPMDSTAFSSTPWGSSRMENRQNMLSEKQIDLLGAVASKFSLDNDFALAVTSFLETKARLEVVQSMESSYTNDFSQYSLLERNLSQLERNVSTYENLLLSLTTSLATVDSLVEDVDSQNFTILSSAVVSMKTVSQKKAMTLLVALFAGLACGCLLAFVVELTDTSVKNEDTIKSILGSSTPSLGWTFFLKDMDKLDLPSPSLVVQNAPNSVFAEKYRSIANNILKTLPQDAKVFSINSIQDCEGRSSTICNVAMSYALSGKKVAIVDADFNCSAVAKIFGLSNVNKGFANVMTGETKVLDCTVSPINNLPNLQIVPAGNANGEKNGFIYNESSFEEAISSLREKFDYVLVDFPALLHCPDFISLSKFMDGYVLNVRAGVETRSSLISFDVGREFISAPLLGYVYYGVIPENQSACGNIGFYGPSKDLKNGKDSLYHVGKGSYHTLYKKGLKNR